MLIHVHCTILVMINGEVETAHMKYYRPHVEPKPTCLCKYIGSLGLCVLMYLSKFKQHTVILQALLPPPSSVPATSFNPLLHRLNTAKPFCLLITKLCQSPHSHRGRPYRTSERGVGDQMRRPTPAADRGRDKGPYIDVRKLLGLHFLLFL